MIAYWLLFLLAVFAAVSPIRGNAQYQALTMGAFAVAAALMIGLRYQIGVDWITYLGYVYMVTGVSLFEAIQEGDPGYMVINWLSAKLGLGIIGVNLVGGGLFIYGLLRFCKQQPFPWIGVAVATPFLIIVVGMGYVRQAIALGFVFFAMSAWGQKSIFKYSFWIVVAALFHRSAVVMLFFGIFINDRRFFFNCLLFFPVALFFCFYLIANAQIGLQINEHIVNPLYESQGGLIRVMMNVAPAVILLLFQNHFSLFNDNRLWLMVAILSFVSIPLVFNYSTLIDRFALYLSPIQIAVYSRLPALTNDRLWRSVIAILILVLYAAVLFVWINYANHAQYWLPYRWIPAQ